MYTLRRVAIIAALVTAWAFSGNDRAPLTLSEAIAAPAAREPSSTGPYELSALRVLSKVSHYVKDYYVDPKRVRPKEMLVAALEAVEKTVPEMMVDGTAESGKVRLNVNGTLKEYDISHVDSIWKMSWTLKDMFEFMTPLLRPLEDAREVEYAAVNGALSTLDPHSIFLRPEVYAEMKMGTRGEFGGLGFVIQMREGMLTVVKVLPKTPAFRAGIKKDDQILKIGEESTVNMDLQQAVGKLRGAVDSKVTITVNRKGWEKPSQMTLTRALITIDSVQSKLLANNIGYVRIKNFQGNTTRDLLKALEELGEQAGKAGPLKGVVLDLRGNPGGLLEQAIQVSDLFLSSGTIVSTVGYSDKLRDEKRAHPDDTDDAFPIAVLINAGSASASEIVAGALKNQNRAVVIGRQSFGKGSVQVLYDNFPGDAALKLTIARYLTPGDVSIQEVGITPDIELLPTRVTKERIDVFAPRRTMGEADLEQHFANPDNGTAAKKRDEVKQREQPLVSLKYLKDEPKKDAKKKDAPKDAAEPHSEDLDDQLDADAQDEVKEDFEVTFAREYLQAAPKLRRDEQLKAGAKFVNDKLQGEDKRIAAAIGALGLDWSPGPTPKNVKLLASLKPGAEQKVTAGDKVALELTVENKGADTVKRLRGWVESDNGYLDRREFVFGALKSGEKRTWTINVQIPKELVSRRDGVTVKLQDDSGVLAETTAGELSIVEIPRPQFAYTWSVLDDCEACNGDGRAQRGEELTVVVDVTNVGTGKAFDVFSTVRNASDENIFIEKGRFKLGELAPGETKSSQFKLTVKKAFPGDAFALRYAVIDEPLQEYTADKLEIPIAPAAPATFTASKGVVKVNDRAELFADATLKRALAKLPKGAVLNEVARAPGAVKVELEPGRTVFVRQAEVKDAKNGKSAPVTDAVWLHHRVPAQITLNVDSSQGGAVATGEDFTLSGVVVDEQMQDLFVLVNDQKVYFAGAKKEDGGTLKFSTSFKLKEGNNVVSVVARETQDFSTRKSVVIRRRGAAVAQTAR